MSLRAQRSLQALLLAGYGLFLLRHLSAGTLFWYINQRFLGLQLLAGIAFLVLARIAFTLASKNQPELAHPPPPTGKVAMPNRDSQAPAGSAWGLALVALPLALGLLVPPRPLGAAAIRNRGLNTNGRLSIRSEAVPAALALPAGERSILHWLQVLNDPSGPALALGQQADVVGFVYHPGDLPPSEFLVSRFAVTCCAADAVAVGMRVTWPGSSALESDAWVRVRGWVSMGSYQGYTLPAITASEVSGAPFPAQPYLHP